VRRFLSARLRLFPESFSSRLNGLKKLTFSLTASLAFSTAEFLK
jgi:hypothetical protein